MQTIRKAFALCEARHEMPVKSAIFPCAINPLDVSGLEDIALEKLSPYKEQQVAVYVTGLTVALVAVINACRTLNIGLTLMHYDRESGSYYEQTIRQ